MSVIAHRGASHDAPENTLAAIDLAVKMGADAVEVDVTMTRDGHVVLFHDRKLQRTTNGKGNTSEMTLRELKELDAGAWKHERYSGERVPTLAEALEACRSRIPLYLEIKERSKRERVRSAKRLMQAAERWTPVSDPVIRMYSESLACAERTVSLTREVIRIVREAKMTEQVVLQSLSAYACTVAAVEAPDMRVEKLCWRTRRIRPLPLRSVRLVEVLNLAGLNINIAGITLPLVERMHETGRSIACYTVNRPASMRHLWYLGVTGVITDCPDVCRAELDRLSREGKKLPTRLAPPVLNEALEVAE